MIEQPSATLCRCGGLLASCADCRGWLVENSSRIAGNWEWWFVYCIENGLEPKQQWGVEAAEADDLAYFACWR
jgi:hypothetical protein